MLCRNLLTSALVAGAFAVASVPALAFSPDDMQIAATVYEELQSQGYDVSNFEDLSLSQISMLNTALQERGNQQLIKGVLSGACGGTMVLTTDQLRELMN